MIEAPAGVDLWELQADATVITTNGDVNSNGRAVMGRGCALEASQMFPELPRVFGSMLRARQNHVMELGPWVSVRTGHEVELVSFPVKHHWHQQADLHLIVRSARELLALTDREDVETAVCDGIRSVVCLPACSMTIASSSSTNSTEGQHLDQVDLYYSPE